MVIRKGENNKKKIKKQKKETLPRGGINSFTCFQVLLYVQGEGNELTEG